jgi:hypothetical protein
VALNWPKEFDGKHQLLPKKHEARVPCDFPPLRWLLASLIFYFSRALWHTQKTNFREVLPSLPVINVWPKYDFFKPYYSVFHRKPFEQNTPECLADLPPFE